MASPDSTLASSSGSAADNARSDATADRPADVQALAPPHRPSRESRRRRLRLGLSLVAVAALLMLAALVGMLSAAPYVDSSWLRERDGDIELAASRDASLRGRIGTHLVGVSGTGGRTLVASDLLLQRSPRWTVDDARREALIEAQQRLTAMLSQGPVTLYFNNGQQAHLDPQTRGLGGLGAAFWLFAALALALVLVGAAVMLAHPHGRNLPYLVITLCQAGSLLAIGIESLPGLGLPAGFITHGLSVRMAFDMFSAAAMVQLATLLPLRLPGGHWIAALTWLSSGLLVALCATGRLGSTWAFTQVGMLGCGALTIVLMSWSYRIEPNPFAVLMLRLASAATATLLLLSVAVAVASGQGTISLRDVAFASVIWYLFLATLTLLLPVFARPRPLMRELAMLSGTSAVATSIDLLFVAVFALTPFVSLSLAVFIALVVYAGTRGWLLDPMSLRQLPGVERMFENLHRVLREVEARPYESAEQLSRLLRELFEPLQAHTVARHADRSRVLGNGSALLVPVPAIGAEQTTNIDESILLRFAARGKRMFSRDDARLTDRVVDQLRRAVAYDNAVERGRSEERARIAQDLHDDIGARLLTLMYRAPSPEIEDYLRHTLKDLKTLTRGLATSEQRLSHAAAEWKADIAQRLAAAQIDLSWSFTFDRDVVLSVVQWSALTRVLRELVSNAIQHSCATHVDVAAALEGGRLRLTLADDGIGRKPQAWSHGLGLGGVRKRVKLLGGDVRWAENGRAGVSCTVLIANLGAHD